jgi:hypothetical protein
VDISEPNPARTLKDGHVTQHRDGVGDPTGEDPTGELEVVHEAVRCPRELPWMSRRAIFSTARACKRIVLFEADLL